MSTSTERCPWLLVTGQGETPPQPRAGKPPARPGWSLEGSSSRKTRRGRQSRKEQPGEEAGDRRHCSVAGPPRRLRQRHHGAAGHSSNPPKPETRSLRHLKRAAGKNPDPGEGAGNLSHLQQLVFLGGWSQRAGEESAGLQGAASRGGSSHHQALPSLSGTCRRCLSSAATCTLLWSRSDRHHRSHSHVLPCSEPGGGSFSLPRQPWQRRREELDGVCLVFIKLTSFFLQQTRGQVLL